MYVIGQCLFNENTRRVSCDNGQSEHKLSPKASEVFLLLVKAQGKVISRTELLDLVWPDVCVGEEVLTQVISELRRALGDSTREPKYIETVYKSGYRICTDIKHQENDIVTAQPERKLLELSEISANGVDQEWSILVTNSGRVRPLHDIAGIEPYITTFGWILINRQNGQLNIFIDLSTVTFPAVSYLLLELDACRLPIHFRVHGTNGHWISQWFEPTSPMLSSHNARMAMGYVISNAFALKDDLLEHHYLDIDRTITNHSRLGNCRDIVSAWSCGGKSVNLEVFRAIFGDHIPDYITVSKESESYIFKDINFTNLSQTEKEERLGNPLNSMSSRGLSGWLHRDYEQAADSTKPRIGKIRSIIYPATGPYLSTHYRLVLPNADNTITTFMLPMTFEEYCGQRTLSIS